jgi:hypothetical protein
MEDAASLRRQERSLRLAKAVSDEQASAALTAHAAELLKRAAALENEAAHTAQLQPEQQPAAQQQQQIQPKKEEQE